MIENNRKILLDASFVANFLNLNTKENEKIDSLALLVKDHRLIAPSIIFYEIGNIFLKYPKIDIKEHWSNFIDLELEKIEISELDFLEIHKLAQEYKLSFYAATYVAALRNDKNISKFYTFDRDFLKVKNKKIEVLQIKDK